MTALENVYGHSVVSSGPVPLSGTIASSTGSEIIIKFDDRDDSGLMLRLDGDVRQICPEGQTQSFDPGPNLPPQPVPIEQCGAYLTGFEVRNSNDDDGKSEDYSEWEMIVGISLEDNDNNILKLTLGDDTKVDLAKTVEVRYLWGDWPVPTVYTKLANVDYVDSDEGQLPVAPFTMTVN